MKCLPLLLLLSALGISRAETVLRQSPIPNRLLRQGEALLIEADDTTRFVRIDLHTRHLDRIEAKIIESETRNWPDSPDSTAYIEALRRVCREARAAQKGPIALRIDWTPDRVTLAQGESVTHLDTLSPEYLRENLVLILVDRFALTPDAARTLLTP